MAEETTLDAAFAKIRTQVNSGVAAVRRPATLLTAIDSTLKHESTDKDTTATLPPAAYLVALLSTLSQLTATPAAAKSTGEKRELLEATLYLLSLLTPHLEPALLRTKLSVLATIAPLFPAFNSHAPGTKSLLAIAQSLLSSLSAQQLEKDLPARTTYAHVLQLCADARPKVRRRAQEAVGALLGSPPPPAVAHPYAEETAGWILARLDEAVKGAKRGGKKEVTVQKKLKDGRIEVARVEGEEGQLADEGRAIALLVFIKNLAGAWSDDHTPELLPTLLSTLTLSSPHLTLSALTLLSHLFSAARSSDSMNADSVKDTLTALIEAKPKVGDGEGAEKLLAGWVEGVGEGMVAFARTDPAGALAQTATLFPSIIQLLPSATTPALRQSITAALDLQLKHCITDTEITAALDTPAPGAPGSTLLELISLVEKAATSPRFAGPSVPYILSLSTTLFLRLRLRPATSTASERPAPAAATLLAKMIVLVGKMREDGRFEWKREAEGVLDAAIKVCGPEAVLRVLPLGLGGSDNPAKARAWLLPLLKPSVTNTRLGHFKEVFVPLSAELFAKAADAREKDKGMEAKVWDTLVAQVWSLLGGYCEYPTDLVDAFDADFVSLIANVLYTQPALRPAVFKALSVLLTTTVSLANSSSPPELLAAQFGITPAEGKASLAHLQALASSILGVAFNVYGQLSRGEGSFILSTVGEWMAILPPAELAATYDRVEGLLIPALAVPVVKRGHGAPKAEDDTLPPTHALLDILITLIPHAGPVEQRFFDLAMSESVLGSADQAVQKKGYRILARLAEERDGQVVKGNVGEVLEKLVELGPTVAQGAKRDRTVLLSTLVPLLPADALHHVPSLIPEAVLGTKESNERTREAAYELLVGMGNKMAAGGVIHRNLIKGMEDAVEDDTPATAEEFVTMVSAGLAGSSPHMISATITSLSRLIFEFHHSIAQPTMQELTATLVLFLTSANREVVRSAIGFVKVATVSLPSSVVEPALPELVPALINWSHEHSNHFKVKIRHLFERLIRKYGVDQVERYVPEEDRKLVQNIRKRQMRAKKKKAAQGEEDADRMDDEDEQPKPQAAGRSAYEEVLYGGSDSEMSGSDDEREAGQAGVKAAAAAGPGNRKSQARKNKAKEGGAFIHEGDDEVLDLLDDRMMSKISAQRPVAAQPTKSLASKAKTDAASGKLRFDEDSDDDRAGAGGEGAGSMGAYLEAMRGEDGHTRNAKGLARFNKTQGKRHRGDEDVDEGAVTEGLKVLEVGGGGRGDKRKKVQKETTRIGGEFKAKRAGGDVKKNGMTPYAYVPLQAVAGKHKASNTKLEITGYGGKKGKKN